MWSEYTMNPQIINNIFSAEPSLANIELKMVKFHREGPIIEVHINLNDYPECPPKKWKKGNYNCVVLEIKFIDVANISMNGWESLNKVDLSIKKQLDLFYIEILNNSFDLKFFAKHIFIGKISAFKKQNQSL